MSDGDLIGQILAGKYRVEKVLGKGGMGLVVGARHVKLDDQVAIKLLRPIMMEVPGMVTRFLREAQAASRIKSPHVVRVTDVDTLPDGVPYMVMELLDGIDFCELRKQRGRLGVTEAVGYLRQACDAIGEAHTLGIVHRDLKPGNLFLHQRRDGRSIVKVLDFGISKIDAPGEQDTTQTGQMMGSPKYMAPEQMLSMHDVDCRSDIWSLGAILYELLTGKQPFVAETTAGVCALVLHSDPTPPGSLRHDLPAELASTILRCLEKDRSLRFSSIAALIEALAPFGPAPPELTRTGITNSSILLAPQLPGVTPTPASFTLPEVETKIEAPAFRPRPGRRRLSVGVAALALLGGLAALFVTLRERVVVEAVPAAGAQPRPSVASLPSAAPSAAPTAAPTSQPARPALAVGDLPDAPSATGDAGAGASARAPAPPSSAGAGLGFKKPRPPGPAADPFGGKRN